MRNLIIAILVLASQSVFADNPAVDKELVAIEKAATHCGFLASFKMEVEEILEVGGLEATNDDQINCLKALNKVNPDWLDDTLSQRDFNWFESNQDVLLVDDEQPNLIGRPKLDFDIDEDDRPDFQ